MLTRASLACSFSLLLGLGCAMSHPTSVGADRRERDRGVPDPIVEPVGPTPRLVAPPSTARVASTRPALAFDADAVYEACEDRTCEVVLAEGEGVAWDRDGDAWDRDLPPGVVFVRARAPGGREWSRPWPLFVEARGGADPRQHRGVLSDYDGDGLADIVVGDPFGATGEELRWLSGADVGTRGAGWRAVPLPDRDYTFQLRDVAAAGDVDADGYADLVVGAVPLAAERDRSGRAWVLYGGPDGPGARTAELIPSARITLGSFGAAVAAAGDLDGDGYGDVAVAAPDESELHVFFGRPGELESSWDIARGQPVGGARRLEGGCDLSGDGDGDLVVGWPYDEGGGAGLALYRQTRGITGGVIREETGGTGFGGVLRCAGDLDLDGRAEVLVGAPYANRVLIVGFDGETTRELAPVEGDGRWGARFGEAVAVADLDGDGAPELYVGDSTADAQVTAFVARGEPRSYRLPGEAWGASEGVALVDLADVDGDGLEDLLVVDRGSRGASGAAWILGPDGATRALPGAVQAWEPLQFGALVAH